MFGRVYHVPEKPGGGSLGRIPYRILRYGPVWLEYSTEYSTKFGTDTIPVPDTSVSSIRPPKIPRAGRYTLYIEPYPCSFCIIIRGAYHGIQNQNMACKTYIIGGYMAFRFIMDSDYDGL